MADIVNLSRRLAGGNITIALRFLYSEIGGNENHILIDFDSISIGNDDVSDIIYYPSNFKINIKVDGSLANWYDLYKDLLEVTCAVDLYDGSDRIWSGYVYQDDVGGDSFTKTLEFTAIDQMNRLKNYKPSDNPFSYDMGNADTVVNIIKDILTSDTFFHFPLIEDVVYVGSVEIRNDFGGGDIVTRPFTQIYAPYSSFYDANSNYEDMLQLLKQILLNYNCMGYVGFDRKFYLIPRIPEDPEIITISKDQLNSHPEWERVRKMIGLRAHVYTGAYDGNMEKIYYEVTRGDVDSTDNKKVEEIYIDQPCGFFGTTSWSGILLKDSSDVIGWVEVDPDGNFRTKDRDGNYTDWQYLWQYVVDNIWELIQYDREKVKVKVDGSYNSFPIWKYYQIEGIPLIFRAAKCDYDFKKKEVGLNLRQT